MSMIQHLHRRSHRHHEPSRSEIPNPHVFAIQVKPQLLCTGDDLVDYTGRKSVMQTISDDHTRILDEELVDIIVLMSHDQKLGQLVTVFFLDLFEGEVSHLALTQCTYQDKKH